MARAGVAGSGFVSRKTFTFRRGMTAGVSDHATTARDHNAWFRRQVQAGLDDAKAGRLVPAEEVEAEFAVLRAATRRRVAAHDA